MEVDNMVHMANQIANFFASYPTEQAVAGVADHLQKFLCFFCGAGCFFVPPESQTDLHILVNSHRPERFGNLMRSRDTCADGSERFRTREIFPLEFNFPRSRLKRAGDKAQKRGLACAVRPDQSDQSARLDFETHVFHRRESGEISCQVL